jgi:hypothetical protein
MPVLDVIICCGACEHVCIVLQVQGLLDRVLEEGHWLDEDEIVTLFSARGADFTAVCQAAGGCWCPCMLICTHVVDMVSADFSLYILNFPTVSCVSVRGRV